MSAVFSVSGEMILRLREQEPTGLEIVRMIGAVEEPSGSGTATRTVYIVVVRRSS